jgi:hypothetical protein
MASAGRFSRLVVLTGLAVFLSFSALSATFYAGIVSETDVSQTIISGRWMGVSGEVDRGNDSLDTFRIGSLSFQENQTGEVLTAELEGVRGGGFYLSFAPEGSLDASTISNVSSSDLESGGIFSEEEFPSFYPNYSQKFDNPSRTFDSWEELKLNGEVYNASLANLSGSADMYVLKYSDNSTEYPLFVSPIDGLERGSSFQDCYVSGCNFQALLPRLQGSDFSYSVYLFSKGRAVTGCDPSLRENETAIVLEGIESSGDCLDIEAEGSYLDFYNSRLEGDSEQCGVALTGEDVVLKGPVLSGFSEAICVNSGSATIDGGDLGNNEIGISASGNFTATDLSIEESNIGLTLQQDAHGTLENVSLGGTRIYGEARSVSILSYSDTLPSPVGADQLTPVGSRVRVESTSQDARFEDLGLGYDLNLSNIEPNYIYKYDESGSSYNTTRLNVTLDPNNDFAYYDGVISEFSVFSLYGEEVEGEDSGDGSEEESGQGGSGSGGGGSGGGAGGGGGGGAAVPGLERPEPATLNLSLEQEFYNVKRGDTVSIGYSVNNTGEVTVGNVTARLDSDWTSVPNTFDALQPDEVSQGTILLTVPEEAPEGNTSIDMEALYQGSALDSEELVMNVSDLLEESRLEVVESPPFLNLPPQTRQSIGVQVENPTNRPIEDLSVEFRGENECATVRDETYSIPANTARNIQVVLQTSESFDVCNDALVFRSGSEIMGFAPMRIEIQEDAGAPVSVPVYAAILIIWTGLLAWRLRNKGSRRGRGFI